MVDGLVKSDPSVKNDPLIKNEVPVELSKGFDLNELINGTARANQKVIENYLDNFSSYNHDVRDIFLTWSHFFTKLSVSPLELLKVQDYYFNYLNGLQEIWKRVVFKNEGDTYDPLVKPAEDDKRFRADEWTKYPYFDLLKQNYILTQLFISKVIDEVEMNSEKKEKLEFYGDQFTDLLSPSNFLFTNPEAIDLAIKTNGESLWKGFKNFLTDLETGKISQTTESDFKVGENLAVTPGDVVYENELIQLIQYRPATGKVHEIPLLMIPPWINKYYILDLSPENSMVKYLVDKGFTVFIISWRNPKPRTEHFSFCDYVQKGALSAIKVVREICAVKKINVLGYCVGGTLTAVAASILASEKNDSINTITFLAGMVDFTDIGPMGCVVDKALVNKLERGELKKEGVLHGYDMETAFNLIRVNDLVWNYAVNNYLKGLKPRPFDVLYWTNDNTNLPSSMYLFYMKEMILGNKLSRKNALHICNIPIDIGKIEAPVFDIGFKDDNISPAHTVFTTTELVSGPVEFILGESGHVMGVANPPSKKKYGHFSNGKLGLGFEGWKRSAVYSESSWWITWSDKLSKHSGKSIDAPGKSGNSTYKIIEKAPGKYAYEKCGPRFKN